MEAGKLGKQVSFTRPVAGFDEIGQPVNQWPPTVTTWASVKPIAGREYFTAAAIQ